VPLLRHARAGGNSGMDIGADLKSFFRTPGFVSSSESEPFGLCRGDIHGIQSGFAGEPVWGGSSI
jgi:hypothetical protein